MADKCQQSHDCDMENLKKLEFLTTFLESSSSEEDEMFIAINSVPRPIPKITSFLHVIEEFNEHQFRKHFRMGLSTVQSLIHDYSLSEYYLTSHTWLRGLKKLHQICTFMCFCGLHVSVLRAIGLQFNLSISSVHLIIEKMCNYLVEVVPKYISFPKTPENKSTMASNFEKVSGFPGILGCIDGTSINIVTPANKLKSTYTNRHDLPSITLQAICSYDRKFLDVFTGIPGKIHDARVFKLSDISKDLPKICGANYHIIGDNAYSIREWCLTPYKEYGNLSQSQQIYNKKFCATRVLIENTFGIFKSRFRQLLNIHMHKVDKISKFIVACCVVHNLCMLNNDLLTQDEMLEECQQNNEITICETEGPNKLKKLGEAKRKALSERFLNLI